MKMHVPSLTSLRGLRIWHYRGLPPWLWSCLSNPPPVTQQWFKTLLWTIVIFISNNCFFDYLRQRNRRAALNQFIYYFSFPFEALPTTPLLRRQKRKNNTQNTCWSSKTGKPQTRLILGKKKGGGVGLGKTITLSGRNKYYWNLKNGVKVGKMLTFPLCCPQ